MTGQSLGATAHHVRALVKDGYLDWAGERRARGALQTFYVISDLGREALLAPRIDAVLTLFGAVGTSRHGVAEAGELDKQAHEELSAVIAEMRPRVLAILQEWVDRAAAAPGD